MREVTLKVEFHAPQATELQKLEKKSLVTFIYVGKPTPDLRAKMGSETRIQLNDAFAETSEIQDYIAQEKSSMKEEDQPFMTVSIKADKETKMGIITDIKQALREAYALKISYSAPKRTAFFLCVIDMLVNLFFYMIEVFFQIERAIGH